MKTKTKYLIRLATVILAVGITTPLPAISAGTGNTQANVIGMTGWAFARHPASTVYFGFDLDNLDRAARVRLAQQAAYINSRPHTRFAVTGHTDKVGDLDYNWDLGMRRATRVVNYLVRLGVDRDQLTAMVSYGEERPAVDVEHALRENRRVTTTVMSPFQAGAPRPKRERDTPRVTQNVPTGGSTTSAPDPAPTPVTTTVALTTPPNAPAPDPVTPVAAPAPTPTVTPTPAPTTTTTTPTAPTASDDTTTTTKTRGNKPVSPGNSASGTGRPDAGSGNGDEPSGDPEGSIGHNQGGDECATGCP